MIDKMKEVAVEKDKRIVEKDGRLAKKDGRLADKERIIERLEESVNVVTALREIRKTDHSRKWGEFYAASAVYAI